MNYVYSVRNMKVVSLDADDGLPYHLSKRLNNHLMS